MTEKKKDPWAEDAGPSLAGKAPGIDEGGEVRVVDPWALVDEPRPTPRKIENKTRIAPGYWGPGAQAANGLFLGGFKPLAAASMAAGQGFKPGSYEYSEQLLDRAQEGYEEESPFEAAALEFGGALPSTMVPLGLVTKALKAVPYAGKYLAGTAGYGRVGEALPGMANFGKRVAGQATAGTVQGAGGAALMSGLSDEPFMDDVERGALFGGPTGALLGTSTNALMNFVRGPVVNYDRATLAKYMLDKGIPLRGEQVIAKGPHGEEQRYALERELGKLIGEELGPDEFLDHRVLERASSRISQQFNDAADANGFYVDDALLHRLGEIESFTDNPQMALALGGERLADGTIRHGQQANDVRSTIQRIRDMGGATWNNQFGRWDPPSRGDFWTPRGGTAGDEVRRSGGAPHEVPRLSGETRSGLPNTEIGAEDLIQQRGPGAGPRRIGGDVFQALTEKDSLLWKLQHEGQGTVRNFSNALRDSLEDALERGSGAEGAAAIKAAREQYRNMMLLAPIAGKGEAGTTASRLPSILETKYNKMYPNAAYDADDNDLNQLVRGSRAFFGGADQYNKMPWVSKRAQKEFVTNQLLSGTSAAVPMLMYSGNMGATLAASGVATAAAAANQYWKSTPTLARNISNRSMMAERRKIPSSLQPGLNKLTRAAILGESELAR